MPPAPPSASAQPLRTPRRRRFRSRTSPPRPPRAEHTKGNPRAHSWAAKLGWALALLGLLIGLIWLLWPLFSILFAAVAFAYLLDPVVDRFEARGRSREFGIACIFLAALGGLAGLVLLIVPSVARQVADLSANLGAYIAQLSVRVQPALAWVQQHTGYVLPYSLDGLGEQLRAYLQEISPDTQASAKDLLGRALSSGFHFVLTLMRLLLLPVFLFYILRDWDKFVTRIHELVPPRFRGVVEPAVREIDARLAGFVRGQITVCFILAALYSAGLWAFSGIDMPIVVGSLAGFLFVIPYVGTVLGVVLGSVLALLEFGFDYHLFVVWAVFGVVQALEGFVLTPNIVGDKVGLSPLVVMIALIVGGNLLGLWGMLLAIPITAALSVALRLVLERYRESNLFKER